MGASTSPHPQEFAVCGANQSRRVRDSGAEKQTVAAVFFAANAEERPDLLKESAHTIQGRGVFDHRHERFVDFGGGGEGEFGREMGHQDTIFVFLKTKSDGLAGGGDWVRRYVHC